MQNITAREEDFAQWYTDVVREAKLCDYSGVKGCMNFENVGYAEVDKAGIYNILIMEEKQTILAAGAGASTKLVLPEKIQTAGGKKTNLIRIENVKNIMEYIHRIDEMIERKGEWLWH